MSSETKWTKGPWSVDGSGIRAVVRGADATIVSVRHRLSAQVHEANATLIAASPKLYEALANMVEWHAWSLAESERRASEFLAETGMLAPFKDAGAVANEAEELHASRSEEWRAWCAKKNSEICGAAWAALASARGEG